MFRQLSEDAEFCFGDALGRLAILPRSRSPMQSAYGEVMLPLLAVYSR